MRGAILIVARNNLALTKAAVRTAAAQSVPCQILVIDNASTDGTIDWLRTKDVAALHFQEQRSLAECWNTGLRAIWIAGYRQALVLNNDVEIRPDTYSTLLVSPFFTTCISVDSRERLGMAGDRTLTDLLVGARPHPDFSAFMIWRSVTDTVGWFDPKYFVYCEDCDYHVRMHRAGIKAQCIDLPFYHVGASTLKNADPGEAARIKRYADDSRQLFRQKYGCYPGTPKYEKLFSC